MLWGAATGTATLETKFHWPRWPASAVTIQHWSLFDNAQHTCARRTPGRGWPGSAVEECKLAVLSTGLGTSWNADALAGRRAGTSVRHAALPFCDAAAASGKAAAVAVTRSVAVWAVNRGRGCSDVSPGEPASSLHAWTSPCVHGMRQRVEQLLWLWKLRRHW